MKLRVNGGDREAPEGASLLALIESLGLQTGWVAVELNGRVIARAELPQVLLQNGDVLEVVQFVGGG